MYYKRMLNVKVWLGPTSFASLTADSIADQIHGTDKHTSQNCGKHNESENCMLDLKLKAQLTDERSITNKNKITIKELLKTAKYVKD